MAHTTNIYYRDRLGFEPEYESHLQANSQHQTTVTKSTLYTSSTSKTAAASSSSVTGAVSGTVRSYSSKQQSHHSGSAVSAGNGTVQTQSSSQSMVDHQQSSNNSSHGIYEENLTKFKGLSENLV